MNVCFLFWFCHWVKQSMIHWYFHNSIWKGQTVKPSRQQHQLGIFSIKLIIPINGVWPQSPFLMQGFLHFVYRAGCFKWLWQTPIKPGNLESLQVQQSQAAQRASLQRHPPAWQQLGCKGNMFVGQKQIVSLSGSQRSKFLEIVFYKLCVGAKKDIGIHRNPWKTKKVKKLAKDLDRYSKHPKHKGLAGFKSV